MARFTLQENVVWLPRNSMFPLIWKLIVVVIVDVNLERFAGYMYFISNWPLKTRCEA